MKSEGIESLGLIELGWIAFWAKIKGVGSELKLHRRLEQNGVLVHLHVRFRFVFRFYFKRCFTRFQLFHRESNGGEANSVFKTDASGRFRFISVFNENVTKT